MKQPLILLLALLFCLSVSTAQAAYIRTDETISLTNPVQSDVLVSGEDVIIEAPVAGEVFALGGTVTVEKRPERSIFAAGSDVTVSNGAGYNAFIAGRSVTLKGTIEHDVYVFAQRLVIDPSAVVKGDARFYVTETELNGAILGNAWVEGQRVSSGANVGRSLSIRAEALSFTGGRIGGNLEYGTAQSPLGLEKVVVGGQKVVKDFSVPESRSTLERWLFHLLSAFVTGAALILLMRRLIDGTNQRFVFHWGASAVTGLLMLIAFPLLALLLIVSEVGLPLGIAVLAVFIASLLFAGVLAQMLLGNLLLGLTREPRRNWWLALGIGAVLYALIQSAIPNGSALLLTAAFFVVLVIPTFGAMFLWLRSFTTSNRNQLQS